MKTIFSFTFILFGLFGLVSIGRRRHSWWLIYSKFRKKKFSFHCFDLLFISSFSIGWARQGYTWEQKSHRILNRKISQKILHKVNFMFYVLYISTSRSEFWIFVYSCYRFSTSLPFRPLRHLSDHTKVMEIIEGGKWKIENCIKTSDIYVIVDWESKAQLKCLGVRIHHLMDVRIH